MTAIRRSHVVEYLKKGTSVKFTKTNFYFLKSDDDNKCWIELTGKQYKLCVGEGIQVPHLLNFEVRKAYIDRLQNTVPKL